MDGLLVINKPAGPTSHDVVAHLRRVLGEPRVGHTGTLDPRASGVLPLVVGRATRLARFLSAADKTYEADVRLGYATTTGDTEGEPIGDEYAGPWPTASEIERTLERFRGAFAQQPPIFSAKKIGGTRSYQRARGHASRGMTAALVDEPAPINVQVHALELLNAEDDRLRLRVTCSAGFYVRALARDLGACLGTGGHLDGLVRTRSGQATLDEALPLHAALDGAAGRHATETALIPVSRMLPETPSMSLTADGVVRARHGRDVRPEDVATDWTIAGPWVRLLDIGGELVALATVREATGVLHPSVVLV